MRLTLLLFVVALVLGESRTTGLTFKGTTSSRHTAATVSCLSKRQILSAIQSLRSGERTRVDRARGLLIRESKVSPACRSAIIRPLMKAMDKPNVDFVRNAHSYYLWLSGAELLGDLKAEEALNLLISHLNLTHPLFSSSMNHQPALVGLIRMGPIAIPKLTEVLRSNGDPKVRYSAIYGIATIGGESAVTTLRDALGSESDECAKRLIRKSLESFDEKGHIKDRMNWFAGFTCH